MGDQDMCRFLTGPARLQQTEIKRVWKLLDNEIFKDYKGNVYLTPRNMLSDNYTIPMWVSVIAGSPVDYDTRASHLHDLCCYLHEAVMVSLTEEELIEKGYLRYSEKNKMWVCEDIPEEYLFTKKVSKFEANNILYECMEVAGVPFFSRIIIRLGVAFNVGWYFDLLFGKIFEVDFKRIYKGEFWRENFGRK